MFKSTPLPPTRLVFLIIDSYLTHRPSLDMVPPVTNEYFSRNHYVESGDDRILKQCQRHPVNGVMINSTGKECTVGDKCGQAVRYLYREVAKFEGIVGPITRLSKFEESWRNDEDA